MRIWDLSPEKLCRNHLLGEHSELHALWSILTKEKKGFSNHPETVRWRGKLKALYLRHEKLVGEMRRRGYKHNSPLSVQLATGNHTQTQFVDPPAEQMRILREKGCGCRVRQAPQFDELSKRSDGDVPDKNALDSQAR